MVYCKYFNDDCYAPFCSAFPHSITNKCPHMVASEKELLQIDKEEKLTSMEEIFNFYGEKGEK